MTMTKTSLNSVLVTALLSGVVLAEPLKFDFKDPKGVNNVVFKLDAPLEAINGSASGITGSVTFDPANPASTTGKIVVEAKSMTVPNSMMKDHMHGEQWMNVAQHPELIFEAKELKNVKTSGDSTTAEAVGTFTAKGVSKTLTVPIKLTYLKDKLQARQPNAKGDLLVIRSTFTIKRADYGINPGAPTDKVADEIELTLSLAGASAK